MRFSIEPRGYDDISYSDRDLWMFEKTAQNAPSDGVGSNFSGAAFCLPHQLVGFLLTDIWIGHVMRFHGNGCYGNQSKCVFEKRDPKLILAVN